MNYFKNLGSFSDIILKIYSFVFCLLLFIFRDVRNVHRKTSFGPTIYVTSFFGWTFDSTRFKCTEQIFPINSLSKTDRQTFDRLVKSFGNPNK